MNPTVRIERRRKELLEEMAAISTLKRATLSRQTLRVKHKGKKEPVLPGPYYVLVRWEDERTRSRRVRAGESG